MREMPVSERYIKVAEPHGFTRCINMVSGPHGIISISTSKFAAGAYGALGLF
jgi:hypothetical protein